TGCTSPGPGLAVPKDGAQYNYVGLTDCAKKLKDASPDFKDETQVTITANPGIDYQTLIRAIDALRRSKEGEDLFPDVHFGVPRAPSSRRFPDRTRRASSPSIWSCAAPFAATSAPPRSTSSTSPRCST